MKTGCRRALGLLLTTTLIATCASTAPRGLPSSPSTTEATSVERVAAKPATTIDRPSKCRPNDAGGPVIMWHTLGGNAAADVLLQLQTEFNSSHHVQLESVHVGGEPELLAKLANTPFSEWPDIVVSSEKTTRSLIDTEHFLAPAACDAAAGRDLLPLARSTYTMDGQLAALPWGLSVPVLVFNSTKYSAAGLDPADPPTTLDALLDVSAKIKQSGASPYGLVMSDWCANYVLEQYSAKRGVVEGAPDNGHTSRNVNVDFATPANIADLGAMRNGVEAGHVLYIGDNGSGLDDLVQISGLDTGATMTIHTSGALGDIIDLLASGNFPGAVLGVGPMPGPGPGSLVGGNALWVVDHGDSARAGRAWAVLDWLYQPDHLARFASKTGYVPPTESAVTDKIIVDRWIEYPQLRVAYDQLLATPVSAATSGMIIGPSSDRDSILFGACTRMMAAGADIETTLREASQLVNNVVATYESHRAGSTAQSPVGSSPTTSSTAGLAKRGSTSTAVATG